MDLRSNFSARRGVTPANQRPASLPIRAPITIEGYSSSDASSYEGEESLDSEETRALVEVSTGDSLDSNVEMPRARLTPEDEDFDDESFEDGSFEEEGSGVEEEFSVGMEEGDGVLNEERGERGHGLLVSAENEGGEGAQGNGNGAVEVEGVGFDGSFGEAAGEVGRDSSEIEEEFSVVMEEKDGFSAEERVEGEEEDVGCGWYFGGAVGEVVRSSSEITNSVDGKEEMEVVEDAAAVSTEYTLESMSGDSVANDAAEFGGTIGVKLGDEISDLTAISAILNKSNGAASAVDGFSDQFCGRIGPIRAKYLRLLHSLDRSPHDGIAVEVLSLLDLAQGSKQINDLGVDMARWKALQSEENGKSDLDFRCNILLLGKSGVGKSAMINAIFGEDMCATSAFAPATKSIQEMVGVVNGVEISVVDTPGLTNSVDLNTKILSSIKKHIKRRPPDVILYVSRLDVVTSDLDDLPSLRLISSMLGSSIWSRCIPIFTHGSYSPDDGSYGVFVEKRCRAFQNSLQLVSGNMHATNPVALVESHPSCTRDEAGEIVLPNGLPWRSHLLLMCYSLRILSEAISVLKSEDPPARSFLGFGTLFPPLPHFLSNLLQCKKVKNETKLSTPNREHGGTYFREYYHQIRLLQKKDLDWELRETEGREDGCDDSRYCERTRSNCDGESVVQATSQLISTLKPLGRIFLVLACFLAKPQVQLSRPSSWKCDD